MKVVTLPTVSDRIRQARWALAQVHAKLADVGFGDERVALKRQVRHLECELLAMGVRP